MDKEYVEKKKFNKMNNFKNNDKVFLETSNECFIGTIKSFNSTRIVLFDVFNVNTSSYIKTEQYFYKPDKLKIRKYNCDTVTKNLENLQISSNQNDITIDELKSMDLLVKNAIYIFQKDSDYHKAINDLKDQKKISVMVETYEGSRFHSAELITFATINRIYVFDIRYIGKAGLLKLKEILEDEKIIKILHDCRHIAFNLKYKHDINISTIIDTLVAHIETGGDKNVTDLRSCISKYLQIPINAFPYEKDIKWHTRPLDKNCILLTAKKTIYLYKLHEVFLNKYLLQDYLKMSNDFKEKYLKLDAYDLAVKVRDDIVEPFENFSIYSTNFKEFLKEESSGENSSRSSSNSC